MTGGDIMSSLKLFTLSLWKDGKEIKRIENVISAACTKFRDLSYAYLESVNDKECQQVTLAAEDYDHFYIY